MHLTQKLEIRKPRRHLEAGIVASQSRTAAAVGADILAAGGTAVDAAVATALALASRAAEQRARRHRLHGRASRRCRRMPKLSISARLHRAVLDPAAFPLTGGTKTELFTWPQVEGDRNIHGPLAFAIPSAVRGYAAAVERFGRMPWRELAAPAARLAREGLPVDWFTTVKVAAAAAELRLYDESRRVWLPDGLPPVCPPEARQHEPAARAGSPTPWTASPRAAPTISTPATSPIRLPPTCALRAVSCRAKTSHNAAPGVMPALAIPPIATRCCNPAPGMTAGPTLAFVIERLARAPLRRVLDVAYYEAVIEALGEAYADRLAHAGDVETAAPTSTSHITAVDREGDDRGVDHDIAVELWQPLCAARHWHPDE